MTLFILGNLSIFIEHVRSVHVVWYLKRTLCIKRVSENTCLFTYKGGCEKMKLDWNLNAIERDNYYTIFYTTNIVEAFKEFGLGYIFHVGLNLVVWIWVKFSFREVNWIYHSNQLTLFKTKLTHVHHLCRKNIQCCW